MFLFLFLCFFFVSSLFFCLFFSHDFCLPAILLTLKIPLYQYTRLDDNCLSMGLFSLEDSAANFLLPFFALFATDGIEHVRLRKLDIPALDLLQRRSRAHRRPHSLHFMAIISCLRFHRFLGSRLHIQHRAQLRILGAETVRNRL